MSIIYEPKGAALEYSPLAANLYRGCMHGCKYCYVPTIPPFKFQENSCRAFHASSVPRKNVLAQLALDARRFFGDKRDVLFCFTSDPYQVGRDNLTTREAIRICGEAQLQVQVLTKGGRAVVGDFDLIRKYGVKFGSTMVFSNDESREEWEPNAATVEDRVSAIKEAHAAGVYTWVSLEPVIYPEQTLEIINRLVEDVDFWKVGKVNHMPDVESCIDWRAFRAEAERLIGDRPHMIKNALKIATQ